MFRKLKYFVCEECKEIVEVVEGSGEQLNCVGHGYKELVANTSEGATEKHIPVSQINSNVVTVKVGEITHPMTTEHYIGFVALATSLGSYRKYLEATDSPEVRFLLEDGERPMEVYAYCNEHGLWKKDL